MILKNTLLLLIVCGASGICIFLGSVLGHRAGHAGLFSGAVIGGIAGVGIAVWLATRGGLLERALSGATFVGGCVGFAVAAVIAVKNLFGPLIPVASIGIIGLGALAGKALGRRRAT